MSDLRACRGCLNTEGPLLSLFGTTLGGYYESIVDKKITHYDGLPLWLCVYCAALTRRSFNFRRQCDASETALVRHRNLNGQLTKSSMNDIDIKTIPFVLNLIRAQPSIYNINDKLKPIDDVKDEIQKEIEIDHSPIFANDDATYGNDEASCGNDEVICANDDYSDEEIKPLAFIRRSEVKTEVSVEGIDEEPETIFVDEKAKDPKKKRKLIKKVLKKKRVEKKETKSKREKVEKSQKKKKIEGGISVKDVEKFATLKILTHEEQVAEVMKRKDSSNYKNNAFKCELCFKGFVDNNTYRNHMERHSASNGDFECSVCRVRRTSAYRLRGHVKAVHSRQYTCNTCQFVSSNANQALEHEKWHRGVRHQCQFCDKTFSKWSSRLSHERLRHRSQFVCSSCGDAFVSELGLTQHRSRAHRTTEEAADAGAAASDEGRADDNYCSECDLSFSTNDAYVRHTLTSVKHGHDDDITMTSGCRRCGVVFSTEAEWLQHARTHAVRCGHFRKRLHITPRIGNVVCMECNEEFKAASHCMAHYKTHHPGVKYPAEFVCETCGRKCKNRAVLLYHQRTHTGERPYPCAVCGAAFKHQSNLRRHSRVHTGEKLFECEICFKRFTQKVGKDLHIQYVHEKVPYPRRNRTRHGDRE